MKNKKYWITCIQNYIRRFLYRRDEWFDLVTPDGRITGKAPRRLCHRGPGKLHRVVHLHVINSRGELYLQKRASHKDIQPGKWDTSVGGHVLSGETVEAALFRETREELGIREFIPRSLFTYIWESDVESELVHTYLAGFEGEIFPDPGEIDDGRFWSSPEIEENLGKGVFTPNFEGEYPRLKENFQRMIK